MRTSVSNRMGYVALWPWGPLLDEVGYIERELPNLIVPKHLPKEQILHES